LFAIDEDGARLDINNAAGNDIVRLGEMAADSGGGGGVIVSTDEGIPCGNLRAAPTGGILSLVNEKEEPRVCATAEGAGGKVYVASGPNCYGGVFAATQEDACLELHEPGGTKMVSLRASCETGGLLLNGPLGDPAVFLAAVEDGGAGVLYDQDGNEKTLLGGT
jgi:hypothetical protein